MARPKIKIPIYKAELKLEIDVKGGSSRPWIVAVNEYGEPAQYIIKPFSNFDLSQIPYINKEFYANYLAQEFEIDVPDSALIHLTPEFIETLDETDRTRIEPLYSKLVFGCRFHDGCIEYTSDYDPKLLPYLDPETIFAFDVLIRNFDRNRRKPNLIISGKEYFCVDHERSLEIHRSFSQYDDESWRGINSNSIEPHLFYYHLKKRQKQFHDVNFREFKELFRTFRPKVVEEVAESLIESGLPADDCEAIMEYLNDVLANKERFFNLLKILLG